MSNSTHCLACGQPLISGATCSECGVDDASFASVRSLPLDPKRNRAANLLVYYLIAILAIAIVSQIAFASARFTNITSIDSLDYLVTSLAIADFALSALLIAIAFQFSTRSLRIAQALLCLAFLPSIWPWLYLLGGVLEMPEKIRALGSPISNALSYGLLASLFPVLGVAGLLLVIRAFIKFAEDLCLPRTRTLLVIAFWLSASEFLTLGLTFALATNNDYMYDYPALVSVWSVLRSVVWLCATVLLLRGAIDLRRRAKRLMPPSWRPA